MSDVPLRKPALSALAIAGVAPYKAEPGEAYMSAKQKQHFTEVLKAWHTQLSRATSGQFTEEGTQFADPADRATQEEEFSVALRNRDREARTLKEVEKALQKLNQDEFGYCNSCGIEIGIARLEARPTADLCVDCKSLAELKRKQISG